MGWGKLTLQLSGNKSASQSSSYEMVVGIAIIIFIGGILNSLELAYEISLHTLTILGFLFTAYSLRNHIQTINLKQLLEKISTPNASHLSIVISIFAAAFVIAYLLPTNAFNFHDDMHSYLTRISQMKGTGTLGHNPIGIIGLDSLGAQAFMQAFAANPFGLTYANGFDAVFCFILSCALTINLAIKMKANWLITFSGLLALIFINMQQVNLSSVYSTTALILGLVHACIYLSENHSKSILSYIPLVLFCSSLIAMKLLTAIFTSIFFILLFLVLNTSTIQTGAIRLKTFITTGLMLILASAPWFLVHADKYVNAITKLINSEANEQSQNIDIGSNLDNLPIDTFFSNNELFWGGSHFGYNSLFLITILIFVGIVFLRTRHDLTIHKTVLLALCGATTLSYGLGLLIFEYNMALRYSLPFLAASITTASILLATSTKHTSQENSVNSLPLTWPIFISAFIFLVFLVHSFSQSFDKRMDALQENRGTLMFPINANYKNYIKESFSEKNRDHYTNIQSLCPEEKGIFAWVSAPYFLNFKENRILTMSEPQTLTPWYNLPTESEGAALRTHLLDRGIQCIIWEHQGKGMKSAREYQQYAKSDNIIYRRLGEQVIALQQSLTHLANSSEIYHNNNGLVVYNISKQIQPEVNK